MAKIGTSHPGRIVLRFSPNIGALALRFLPPASDLPEIGKKRIVLAALTGDFRLPLSLFVAVVSTAKVVRER
jgi:hypothetical protein